MYVNKACMQRVEPLMADGRDEIVGRTRAYIEASLRLHKQSTRKLHRIWVQDLGWQY